MPSVLLWVGIYVVALIALAFWVSRGSSDEDFLIAGRNRGALQILFSKFSGSVGVGFFLVYAAYAYQFGLSTLAAVVGMFVSFLIFAYWAGPKIFKNSQKKKYYTQGDYVLDRTGSVLAKYAVDGTSAAIYFIWILVSFIGGARVIEHIGVLSYEWALFLTAAVILCYILVSGFRAVVLTDVVQGVIIMVLLGFVFTFLLGEVDMMQLATMEMQKMSLGTGIGFLAYGFFSVFGSAERYQLVFAAGNVQKVKKGLAYAVVPITFIIFCILVIGMYMYAQDPALVPDDVFLIFLTDFFPANLLVLGTILLFAGLMSSADTGVYTVTSYITFLKKRADSVVFLRCTTVAVLVLATAVSFFFRDIVEAGLLSGAILLIPSIAMLYIISGGKSSRKFIASLVFSVLAFLAGIVGFGIVPAIMGPPILGGALGLLWKK